MRIRYLFLLVLTFGPAAAAVGDQPARSRIHAEAELVQPLLPGMKAPAFDVLDATGREVRFDPEKMNAPLVLTFYRGGWCPYCNLHLAELRKSERELASMGFEIWFVSIDRPELLYQSLDQPDIGYTLLSDSKLDATRAFGVAFLMPEDMVERYLEYDIDLEAASGETHHVLPAPSTFIIGTDGVIRFQYTNPDYAVRLHPEVLLAAARAYLNDTRDRLRRQYRAKKEAEESEGG